MSHISELFKKVEELQKQIDTLKDQNEKFQDLVDVAGGVIDDTDVSVSSDDKTQSTSGSTPKANAGCGAKLTYPQQVMLKSIVSQLKVKRIPIHHLLSHIDRKLKQNPHFAHEIMKEKI